MKGFKKKYSALCNNHLVFLPFSLFLVLERTGVYYSFYSKMYSSSFLFLLEIKSKEDYF